MSKKQISKDTATSKIKYFEGMPKQYRADMKSGQFNVNGKTDIGSDFSFQPVAWRFFEDDILGMGRKKWVELFFVDHKDCMSVILFHGFSRENLEGLASELFYSDVTLADIVLHVSMQEKTNDKITPKAKYFIAEFDFEVADEAETEKLKQGIEKLKLYRNDTFNLEAEVSAMENYFHPELLEAAEEGEAEEDNESLKF